MDEISVIGHVGLDTPELDEYEAPVPKPVLPAPLHLLRGEAFYAAATMPKEQFAATYADIVDGLSRYGSHPTLDKIRQQGVYKKQEKVLNQMSDLATNPDIQPQHKVPIAQDLIQEASTEPSAKEVYMSSLVEDKKEPMEILVIGEVEDALNDFETKFKEQQPSLEDWIKGAGGIGSALLMSIPAGVLGVYHLIKTRDPAAATEVIQAISQAGYLPKEEGAKKVMQIIAEKAEVLDIPARWVGDIAYDLTGSPAVAAGAYTILDPLNLVPLGVALSGRAAIRAYVRTKFPESKYASRKEPSFDNVIEQGDTIFFDTRNPIGEVSRINREEAAKLATYSVVDGELAKAGGRSPRDILNAYLLPKLDPEIKKVYPDIYDNLAKLDVDFTDKFNASRVSPFLFDVAAIKRDVDMHFDVMDSINSVYPMMSSSYFEDVGRSFRGKLLFGEKPNKGFDSPEEAVDRMVDLSKVIKEKYKDTDVAPKLTVKEVETPFGDKEYFIAWDFIRMYDPTINTSLGTKAKFGPFDVSNLANTKFGQWFYSPATRLAEWTTAGPARATITQTKLEKVWNDVIRNNIISVKPRQELAQAIYETEARGADLSVKELGEMFPELTSKDFKELVSGYYHYRRLVDHMYATMNDIYRTQKVTSGYYGLYDKDGNYINNLGRPVGFESPRLGKDAEEIIPGERKPLIGEKGDVALSVFDFTKMVKDDPTNPGKMIDDFVGEQPVSIIKPDTIVYKLDKPYVKDGKVYEFGIGLKEGAVPKDLLPRIPGYYPHINKEHYFLKAVPLKLELNGRAIPNDAKNRDLYLSHATTVNVLRREKDAAKLKEELTKKNPDFEYVLSVEKLDVDDTLRTTLDMVRYAQDVSKSRKKDRLTLPDGSLGRLEDPAVALEKRLNEAARLISWKDQDFIFRERFTQAYEKFFKGGEFPKSVADIELPGQGVVNSPDDIKLHKEAIVNFEQYARQQTTKNTILDPLWRSSMLSLGRFMEEVTPRWIDKWVEDFPGKIKDAAKLKDPLINSAIKLTTFKYIHLQPLRQWLIQPAQLYELHVLALTNKNTLFSRDMVNLAPKLWASTLFENSSLVPDAAKTFFRESAHANTPYSKKEMDDILNAWKSSGIPYAIDMDAIVDGVFKSASQALDVSKAQYRFSQAGATLKGAVHLPKQVGFNQGELMNNIGLWLYARSEFIKNNPGKKWNDPHNLELIAAKAWGVGNSMLTRADLFPFQEGSLRALMQFASYPSKAVFQPLNSKFLSKEEKTRLAAIRLAAFGMDGVLLGPMILNQVRKRYHEETKDKPPSELQDQGLIDDLFTWAERGLTDSIVNWIARSFFDEDFGAKTDLLVSKDLAPVGGSDVGLPLADLVFSMLKVGRGEATIAGEFPFLQAIGSLIDTASTIDTIFKATEVEKMDIPAIASYINKTTEFASGASAWERHLAMKHHRAIVDKLGKPLPLEATLTEAYARIFGVQSFKDQGMYEIFADQKKLATYIKDTAKKIITDLDAIEDVYDVRKKEYANLSEEEKIQFQLKKVDRINWLYSIYDEEKLGDELMDEVHNQLKMQEKNGIITSIHRMQQRRNYDYYDPARRRIAEIMKRLRESGNEELANQIDSIFLDTNTDLKKYETQNIEKVK